MLRSCYESTWKLFKDSAVTTRGYYYFVPDDTPFYPHPHNYWSINWVNDEQDQAADLGEQLGSVQKWRNGSLLVPRPPAVLVGSATCVESGDVFPEQPIPRLLIVGIDSRCWTQAGVPVPAGPAGVALLDEVQDLGVVLNPGAGIRECQSLTILPSVLTTIAEAQSFTALPSTFTTIAEAESLSVVHPLPIPIAEAQDLHVLARFLIFLDIHEAENLTVGHGAATTIAEAQAINSLGGGAAIADQAQDLGVEFVSFAFSDISQAQSFTVTTGEVISLTIEEAEDLQVYVSGMDVIEQAQDMEVGGGLNSPLQAIEQAQVIIFIFVIH